MSSVTPPYPTVFDDDRRTIGVWINRLVHGVRAAAFWSAAVLPLFIIGSLTAGMIEGYPLAVTGLVLLNVICAIVGHAHTPERV